VSPSSVTAGGAVSASWKIANQGTGVANISTTVVRINQTIATAAGSNLVAISTPGLAAGASQSQSASLAAPAAAGTYYVWVLADDGGSAGENASAALNDIVQIGSFTVMASLAPTVSLSASPSSITAGQSTTLTWSSTNAAVCFGGWANNNTGGQVATSGSVVVSPSATLTYSIVCSGAGANAPSANASVTVTVTVPKGTLTFGASPSSITNGGSSTLTWSTTNMTACSGFPWTSSSATAGSQVVRPTVTTTYPIACSGPYGTATNSATVTVH